MGGLVGGASAMAHGVAEAAKVAQQLTMAQKILSASMNCVSAAEGLAATARAGALLTAKTVLTSAAYATLNVSTNAIGQGIKIGAGLQKGFDWKQTASMAVTGAFSGIGNMGGLVGGFAGDIGGSAVGNLIVNDGNFDATQFVADVASSIGSVAMSAMHGKISTACFVAGTVIHTRKGPLAIEQFVGGEQVLARNEKTLEIAYRGVLSTKVTEKQAIYRVVVGNHMGKIEILRTTAEHPFWIKDAGWKKASLLTVGDLLLDLNNEILKVLEADPQGILETVYNIEVAELHTYHAGSLGVWVHNGNCSSRTEADERPMEINSEMNLVGMRHVHQHDGSVNSEALVEVVVRGLPPDHRVNYEISWTADAAPGLNHLGLNHLGQRPGHASDGFVLDRDPRGDDIGDRGSACHRYFDEDENWDPNGSIWRFTDDIHQVNMTSGQWQFRATVINGQGKVVHRSNTATIDWSLR